MGPWPSSLTSIWDSYSSDRPRIVSPPLPMSRPIWLWSILIFEIRGACGESPARGPARRGAALADEQADLARVDLDLREPRGVRGKLGARRRDDVGHLPEDVHPGLAGLGERLAQAAERHPRRLALVLEGGE